MMAFFSGLAAALALVVGGVILYATADITAAQRSSPESSVRLHAGGEPAQPTRETGGRGPESAAPKPQRLSTR